MSRRRGLRRLWRSPYVAAAAVLLLAAGLAGGGATLASFTAETQNDTSTFAGGWIGSASGLAATVSTTSGYNGELAWTPGTQGLDGQSLYGVDNGTTTTSCPTSGYSLLATTSAAAASLSDSSTVVDNPRSGVDGHYVCYEIVSTRSGSSWTATSPAAGAVLGLVPTGIASSGSPLGTGSTITITFNQNVALPTNPLNGVYVCLQPAQSQIVLGVGSCTPAIGTIGGAAVTNKNGNENDCKTSSAGATGNSIVISISGCSGGKGSAVSVTGTGTYTAAPGTTVTSSVGSAVQCTTSLCQPTGTFS